MKPKYTIYSWRSDDEGGFGVCNYGEFTPNMNYQPETGWRATPSEKIGDFSTMEELADLLFEYNPEWFKTIEEATKEAKEIMQH